MTVLLVTGTVETPLQAASGEIGFDQFAALPNSYQLVLDPAGMVAGGAGRDMTPFFDEVYRGSNTFDYGVQQLTSTPAGKATAKAKTGKAASYISKRLRLLDLIPPVAEAFTAHGFAAHAEARGGSLAIIAQPATATTMRLKAPTITCGNAIGIAARRGCVLCCPSGALRSSASMSQTLANHGARQD